MAITRVAGQHTSVAFTATSTSMAFASNPTLGNLVAVAVVLTAPNLTVTVKDANNNTYTATTHSPATDGTFDTLGIFYLQSAPSNASLTVNITWGGVSHSGVAFMQEYAGAATSSVLEQEQDDVAGGQSSTNINTPSFTPSNNNDLIFTISAPQNSGAAAGPGYSLVDIVESATACTDQIQTTAAATGTYATQSPAGSWFGMVAAFKVAAAGGDTLGNSMQMLMM